jgi:hypothetical protein
MKVWKVGLIILISLSLSLFLFLQLSLRPRVILKVENFKATLKQALIYQGVYATFVTELNFTITNIGSKDSISFIIFIDVEGISRAIPIDPINVKPIKVGETVLIELKGYAGQGYPELDLVYEGKHHKFGFGGQSVFEM